MRRWRCKEIICSVYLLLLAFTNPTTVYSIEMLLTNSSSGLIALLIGVRDDIHLWNIHTSMAQSPIGPLNF